ncbi:MAG: hypothetical protein C0598_00605 [Marinilabiliales bacterium]|nr:MAG: hypothetical protein C0598_00605 [Marinilabiliales bacterium]
MSHFYTEVKNGSLKIYIKDYRKKIHVAKVYITVKNLDGVSLVGSGDITLENTIKTNNFNIKIVGSGDLVAPLDAKNVQCTIAGSGDVKFSGVSGDLEVNVGGSGDTYAKDLKLNKCKISIAGSGEVSLSGSAVDLKVSVSGSGDTDASDLKAVNLMAKIAGSGDVKATVVEELSASIVGSGNVYYYGNPENKNVNIIGSGRAIQK